jgi:2-polyprenyl-3-methyl-5-hydroxy-6-metoxy-1,4-benzoquinol methylase
VDVIVAKAIVEHLAKADLIGLLDAMAGALRPNGMVLIEVPNMDWLLSGHERYMDLTHEVGFTRESLATLLLLRFGDVEVQVTEGGTGATITVVAQSWREQISRDSRTQVEKPSRPQVIAAGQAILSACGVQQPSPDRVPNAN